MPRTIAPVWPVEPPPFTCTDDVDRFLGHVRRLQRGEHVVLIANEGTSSLNSRPLIVILPEPSDDPDAGDGGLPTAGPHGGAELVDLPADHRGEAALDDRASQLRTCIRVAAAQGQSA